MCFSTAFRNSSQINFLERLAIYYVFALIAEPNAGSLSTAEASADKYQGNFHDFKALLDLIKAFIGLYEEYCKAIDDPESSVVFSGIVRRTPFLLPTLLLAEEAGILILKPGLPHFPMLDLTRYSGGADEKVTIAPKVTGPSPERIRAINDKLVKPYSNEELPYGTIITVLSILFKKMRIPIKMNSDRPTTMDFRKFFGTCGVHTIAERFQLTYSNPNISFTEPLDLNQFALSYTGNLCQPSISSLVSNTFDQLTHRPAPSRSIKDSVLQEGRRVLRITDEQTEAADAAAPVVAAPLPGPVAATAVPPTDAINREMAPAPATAVRNNAAMNNIAMDDGATDRPRDNFDTNLGKNPRVAPNPVSPGIISARPNNIHAQTNVQTNRVNNTNDDSIVVLECLDMNRGRKRGANKAQVETHESSTPNSKRQATTTEEVPNTQVMLEAMNAKLDTMNSNSDVNHQAMLKAMNAKFHAMNAKFDAANQANAAAVGVLQAKLESLDKEVELLTARFKKAALVIASVEEA